MGDLMSIRSAAAAGADVDDGTASWTAAGAEAAAWIRGTIGVLVTTGRPSMSRLMRILNPSLSNSNSESLLRVIRSMMDLISLISTGLARLLEFDLLAAVAKPALKGS